MFGKLFYLCIFVAGSGQTAVACLTKPYLLNMIPQKTGLRRMFPGHPAEFISPQRTVFGSLIGIQTSPTEKKTAVIYDPVRHSLLFVDTAYTYMQVNGLHAMIHAFPAIAYVGEDVYFPNSCMAYSVVHLLRQLTLQGHPQLLPSGILQNSALYLEWISKQVGYFYNKGGKLPVDHPKWFHSFRNRFINWVYGEPYLTAQVKKTHLLFSAHRIPYEDFGGFLWDPSVLSEHLESGGNALLIFWSKNPSFRASQLLNVETFPSNEPGTQTFGNTIRSITTDWGKEDELHAALAIGGMYQDHIILLDTAFLFLIINIHDLKDTMVHFTLIEPATQP